MKVICPKCGSSRMVLLFPDNDIWECLDCGYRGKPFKAKEEVLYKIFQMKNTALYKV